MNRKIISLLIFLHAFNNSLSMNLKKFTYDTFLGIPIELWQKIGMMLVPEPPIESTKTLLEIYRAIHFFRSSCKSFYHFPFFNEDFLTSRLLKCCVNNKIIYDAMIKMQNRNSKGCLINSVIQANKNIERFIKISDTNIKEEDINFIKACMLTWNIEMNISLPSIQGHGCEQEHTFLNEISLFNDASLLDYLIALGVNVERKNVNEKTPLKFALSNGCFKSAHCLLEALKKYDETLQEENYLCSLNLADEKYFCENDRAFNSLYIVIKELIENYYIPIDAEIVSYESLLSSGKFSLLFAGVWCDNKTLVTYLMEHGAQSDICYYYKFLERPAGRWIEKEDSPLSFARHNNLNDMVRILESYQS